MYNEDVTLAFQLKTVLHENGRQLAALDLALGFAGRNFGGPDIIENQATVPPLLWEYRSIVADFCIFCWKVKSCDELDQAIERRSCLNRGIYSVLTEFVQEDTDAAGVPV